MLIAGGSNVSGIGFPTILNSAEIYDPATGTFAPTGVMTMSSERRSATATLLNNGKVLIAGGANSSGR